MTHTEGPWKFEEQTADGRGEIVVSNYPNGEDVFVASCYRHDAPIFLAAPEMYALLKKFHQMLAAEELVGYQTVNVHTRRNILPELAAVLKAVEGD